MLPIDLPRWQATAVLALAALAVSPCLLASAPTAEDFGLTPRMEALTMAADGTSIAWIDNTTAVPHVAMFNTATGKVRRIGDTDTSVKLRDLAWLDNRSVLMRVSATSELHGRAFNRSHRYEVFRYMAVDIDGGEQRMLLMADRDRQFVSDATLLSLNGGKQRTTMMSTFDWNRAAQRSAAGTRIANRREDSGWVSTLFQVDVDTGRGKQLEMGTQFTDDWVVNANGEAVARSEWDESSSNYRLLNHDGMGWEVIFERTDGSHPEIAGLSNDGKEVVFVSALGGERRKAWAVPIAGGEPHVLAEDPVAEVEEILRDPLTLAPAGVRFGGATQRTEWFDPSMHQHTQSLERTFKGMRVQIRGRSADSTRVIAAVDGPSRPMTYYLVDFTAKSADILGEQYPQLSKAELGESRVLEYKARDGAALVAYLTLPPGKEAKNLPLIVLPHGGPEYRDDYEFGWLPQFLATRGYAVVQPQFRGSTGFGEAHRQAGFRQWGGLMQNDVTDAVAALIEQGVASADHVCTVGWSYGGYSALAGAAFTPDLYRCAVSIAGVSNVAMMLGKDLQDAGNDRDFEAYLKERIGSQFDQAIIDASPVNAADRVQVPVLLIHGTKDSVVPVQQSRVMAEALQKANKQVRLIEFDSEDHYMSYSETRVRMLKELEAFLAANI